MKIIISSHIDTVFKDPHGTIKDGVFKGPCDNLVNLLVIGRVIGEVEAIIELTNDEEQHMDGARYVARENDPKDTLMIVLDTTDQFNRKVNFTVENMYGIKMSHIKKVLKAFRGKYKINREGEESEAWLYRDMGFCTVEIDVPVKGGLHNEDAEADLEDIKIAAEVLKAFVAYFKDKTREQLSDQYKVGDDNNGGV